MSSRLHTWRTRTAAASVAAAAAFALFAATPLTTPARADTAPPPLPDGYGLTQVPTEPAIAAHNTATDFTITVTTPEVSGRHHIRIVLPDDYFTAPGKRYPVLYLLNGSPGDPADYFSAYPAVSGAAGMIMVMPDGGARSWYTNWRDQNTVLGAQNWENFHIDQVIPFIDADLRTVAAKPARAVGGISMGGFGALHYAERHPDLFSQVATLSGDNDLSAASMDLRMAAVASLTDATGALCAPSSLVGVSCADAYNPGVSSDAAFGSPYPVFNVDQLWNDADPGAHVAALRGMGVAIYVGNGGGGPTPPVTSSAQFFEWWLEGAAKHLKDHLDAAGIPYLWQDYGNGAGWGQCDGGHDYLCWGQDLTDYIPRLQQAFAQASAGQ